MAEIINVGKQVFLSNEITRAYYSSNMLTNFQDFSSDYINNYNSVKTFLYNERQKTEQSSLSFDAFESGMFYLSSMNDESIEELAIKIVNTYYSSGKLSNVNEFENNYLNNYALAVRLLYNEKQKDEHAMNSFEGFENACDAIRLLNRDMIQHLSNQMVNTYYSSGRLSNFNDFASEYINNYRLSYFLCVYL